MSAAIVILVIRDPDFDNDIFVYGADDKEIVLDIDLGHMDLGERDEFLMWAHDRYDDLAQLPDGHPAKNMALDVVLRQGERHGFTSHDAIVAA